ncbi:MAG: NAD(P)-dependent oxidoreductase [Hyphomicrobiales bacterium]|nr:NAD(P)-dependent oxidoreductase [Hyphomicrobiales bacterium]
MTSNTGPVDALVTGGAGFIGSAVVEALCEAGHSVRRGVRARADQSDAVSCNLDNVEQIRAAVEGVRLVVHAAYGDSERMVPQCSALLAAMTDMGINQIVYFSSIAVYGDGAGSIDESAPLAPADAYAEAKSACEQLVRGWAQETSHPNRRALILRPGIVYGAGSRFWIDKLGERIRAGAWGVFGEQGEGVCALVHVQDVARVVVACFDYLERAAGASHVAALNVVGPDTPSWNSYFQALAAGIGVRLAEVDAPSVATRQKAAFVAKVWRRIGLPGGARAALAPTPGEMKLFARKARYATGALTETLGFAPNIGLEQGLRLSLPQAKT